MNEHQPQQLTAAAMHAASAFMVRAPATHSNAGLCMTASLGHSKGARLATRLWGSGVNSVCCP